MKRLLLVATVLLSVYALRAQTVLREATHGLLPGNPNPMTVTEFTDAGASGADVVWDFSALPARAPFRGEVVEAGLAVPPAGLTGSNTCLVEDDLNAFMRTSGQELQVLGVRVGDGFTRRYEQPLVKMRYPFAYGDRFEGVATGVEAYGHGYELPVRVDYTVEADGKGTLVLPGTKLSDALRVVTTHRVGYGEGYGQWRVEIVTYRWYVMAHRFPVLSLIFARAADGTLTPVKGAYNAVVVPAALADAEAVAATNGSLGAVSVYPNPFESSLTVRYELERAGTVRVLLYDMGGALAGTLHLGRQEAGEHAHSLEARVAGLPAGQYVVRVECDGTAVARRVVKL